MTTRTLAVVLGDRGRWAAQFRAWDELFLNCVMRVWWSCVARLPNDSNEDAITAALVDSLSRDATARGLFWCEYQFVPFAYTDDGRVVEKGRVDMAMIVGHDREYYLAYECKRLNAMRQGGARRSLAREYVNEGVMRFVTKQYAENLPTGCMIGYVMDGDLDFTRVRIRAAMTGSRAKLGLQGDLRAQDPIGQFKRFATDHVSGGGTIEILHALAPFVSGPADVDAEGGRGAEDSVRGTGPLRRRAPPLGLKRRCGIRCQAAQTCAPSRQLEALPAVCDHNALNSQGIRSWPT